MLFQTSKLEAVRARDIVPGLLELTWGPLRERLLRGEGALLAVSATWLAFSRPGWALASALLGLSALVLTAAYAFNDWHDAEGDLNDPKKNPALVAALLAWRRPFGFALAALHGALIAAAAGVSGVAGAAAVLSMLGINAVYSLWLKRVPVVDLVVVGLWGAAFVAIVAAPLWLCATVGAMTSLMHLFQIQQDHAVDAENRIDTTVVRLPGSAGIALALICASLAGLLAIPLGAPGALSAAVPVALRVSTPETGRAWMASRVYCGIVLFAALVAAHGMG